MFPVAFALLALSQGVLGANILGVFSITSYSHQVVYRTLMLELNRRGHSVTVVTPNPVRNPNLKNYREIDTSFYYKDWNRKMVADPLLLKKTLYLPEVFYAFFTSIASDMCHAYLSAPQVQALIRENPRFDLLVTEFGVNPCFYGFAKFAGFRHVGMFSLQASPVVHSNLGNPVPASYVTDVVLPYSDRMSFFQRARTLLFQAFLWGVYWYTVRSQDPIAKQYFGDDLPHLIELERNLSALMVNSHFAFGYPRPNVPALVEIGGPPFHLNARKPKPLPQKLKNLLTRRKIYEKKINEKRVSHS